MGTLTNKEDPVDLFARGRISENKLQRRLERITPEEASSYDTDLWSRFLMEINETRHPMIVSAETKHLIIERLSDDLLVDMAVKTRGNDYICALSIHEMKNQDSLRKVLEYYNRFTPFRIFTWEGEKPVYTDHPFRMAYERGGLAVWALLERIDQEHFNQAWFRCGKKSQWVDQLKNQEMSGRYFTGNGFPGWKGKPIMNYMDLLPEVEHRIILAESGETMKTPYHEQIQQ